MGMLTNSGKTMEQVKEVVDKAVKSASDYVIDGKPIRETIRDQKEEAESKSVHLAAQVDTKDIDAEKGMTAAQATSIAAKAVEKSEEKEADASDFEL